MDYRVLVPDGGYMIGSTSASRLRRWLRYCFLALSAVIIGATAALHQVNGLAQEVSNFYNNYTSFFKAPHLVPSAIAQTQNDMASRLSGLWCSSSNNGRSLNWRLIKSNSPQEFSGYTSLDGASPENNSWKFEKLDERDFSLIADFARGSRGPQRNLKMTFRWTGPDGFYQLTVHSDDPAFGVFTRWQRC
jgi:hypothetical protein